MTDARDALREELHRAVRENIQLREDRDGWKRAAQNNLQTALDTDAKRTQAEAEAADLRRQVTEREYLDEFCEWLQSEIDTVIEWNQDNNKRANDATADRDRLAERVRVLTDALEAITVEVRGRRHLRVWEGIPQAMIPKYEKMVRAALAPAQAGTEGETK